jgi:hypothetical protein
MDRNKLIQIGMSVLGIAIGISLISDFFITNEIIKQRINLVRMTLLVILMAITVYRTYAIKKDVGSK